MGILFLAVFSRSHTIRLTVHNETAYFSTLLICLFSSIGGHGTLGLKVPSQDRKIVDNLVNEIRKGKVLRRLSMRHKTGEANK